MNTKPLPLQQKVSLYAMSVLYILAGINHIVSPKFYLAIMPAYIPYPNAAIYISGLAEIILGLLLLFNISRKTAAWGIVVLLVVIFPANVQMLLNYIQQHNPYTWVAVIRLPLQVLLIWWALKQKNVII